MISVKQAVESSVNFLKSIDEAAKDILVEEVDFDSNENQWYITLSFSHDVIDTQNIYYVVNGKLKYKTFKINSNNAEVLSMKIRETTSAQ